MSGPTMSMIDSSNAGIGNYKGVMLCNRPFGGSAAAKPDAKPDTRSFHAGKVPSAVGSTVPIAALEKHTRRPKKESALTKHRKWLAELQKTKDQLESSYITDLQKKEIETMKFQEREAKQRKEAVAMLHKENEGGESSNAPPAAEPKIVKSVSISVDEKTSPVKKKKSNKPAWALTEEKAEVVSEEKEFEDAEGLLDFAAGLNFDKYIDDLEVQTMMEKVKQRIMTLEREVIQDEKRLKEAEERAANRPHMEGEFEQEEEEDDPEDAEQEAAMNAARALLANADSMKAVHSTKSVAAMVKNAKDKDAKGEPVIINQPKIVTHDESAGNRQDRKEDVSNLPYIHRNPAV